MAVHQLLLSAMHSNDDLDWPVHSFMLSFNVLQGLLLRWPPFSVGPPFTVPCNLIFGSISDDIHGRTMITCYLRVWIGAKSSWLPTWSCPNDLTREIYWVSAVDCLMLKLNPENGMDMQNLFNFLAFSLGDGMLPLNPAVPRFRIYIYIWAQATALTITLLHSHPMSLFLTVTVSMIF